MCGKFGTPILILIICVLSASTLNAQGYVDILPDDIQKPFREKYERVSAGIGGFHSNEWAGRYSRHVGTTFSDVLVWTSSDGFAAFRDTCSNGPRAWVNFGSAKFSDGLLILDSEQSYKGEHSLSVDREFTPVKWGHQRWLIPTDELELFAYAVNSASWEAYGAFYLKDDQTEKDPKGHPEIPKQFRHILNRKALKVKLLAASEKPRTWYGDLTIDAGKNKGVIVGMSFWLIGVKNTHVKISVVEVSENTALAEVVGVGYSYEYDDDGNQKGSDPEEFEPKPGIRFTSRSP
ncbi:MAG: hypothetical protein WBO10_07320 [Pyrinomonadaceae bacterium]